MLHTDGTLERYTSDTACSAASSDFAVLGLGVVVPLLFIAWLSGRYFRHRRRARNADAEAKRGSGPLVPGEAVISGRVALDAGVSAAVTVRIVQERIDKDGNIRNVEKWRETKREVIATPFFVVRSSGERVRVEPGDDARLAASLDGFSSTVRGPRLRCRTIVLAEGEQVEVRGTLACGIDPSVVGSYRDSGAPVLRPAPGRPMLISMLPLAEYEKRVARRARACAILTLLVFGVAHATLFVGYDALRVAGRVATADAYSTGHRPSTMFNIWPVSLVLPGGRIVAEERSSPLYYRVQGGKAATVPIVTAGRFHQLGVAPAIEVDELVGFSFFSLCFMVACVAFVRARPWWDGARLFDGVVEMTFRPEETSTSFGIVAVIIALCILAGFSAFIGMGVRAWF